MHRSGSSGIPGSGSPSTEPATLEQGCKGKSGFNMDPSSLPMHFWKWNGKNGWVRFNWFALNFCLHDYCTYIWLSLLSLKFALHCLLLSLDLFASQNFKFKIFQSTPGPRHIPARDLNQNYFGPPNNNNVVDTPGYQVEPRRTFQNRSWVTGPNYDVAAKRPRLQLSVRSQLNFV